MFFDDEPHGVFFLIDNKSFYASCEAVARGLNPLKVPPLLEKLWTQASHQRNDGRVSLSLLHAQNTLNMLLDWILKKLSKIYDFWYTSM